MSVGVLLTIVGAITLILGLLCLRGSRRCRPGGAGETILLFAGQMWVLSGGVTLIIGILATF